MWLRHCVELHPSIIDATLIPSILLWSCGGAVAQSVGCETSGEEVPGSIPAVAARSLLVVSVSV